MSLHQIDRVDRLVGEMFTVTQRRVSTNDGTTIDRTVRSTGQVVTARIGGGPEQPLARAPKEGRSQWQGRIDAPDRRQTLVVRAEDEAGGTGSNAIGEWTAKGIPGGQLGPNKNGRQW